MATKIQNSMRAVALSQYCKPSQYAVATVPTPTISQPDEVIIKVHAASINPIDVKIASGMTKMMKKSTFPFLVGYDAAGVIVAVGSSVTNFKLGDEVYTRVPDKYRGTVAEYAMSTVSTTAKKPKSLSFVEAASIPLAAVIALQCLERGEKLLPGGLKGKTIFIPGGLSGTGAFGVQLAKNVFGAGKVITTLSTGKIPKIKELMDPSVVDQVVDYTKENTVKAVGKGTVDYMFDPVQNTLSSLSVMKKGGVIVSISTIPSGTNFKKDMTDMPLILEYLMNAVDWVFRTWASWHGVDYSYMIMDPNAADLERLTAWVDEGKVKPIVGMQTTLSDIEGIRKGCQQVLDGKGGIGKFVIEID